MGFFPSVRDMQDASGPCLDELIRNVFTVPSFLSMRPGSFTEPRVMAAGRKVVVIVGDRTIATDATTMPGATVMLMVGAPAMPTDEGRGHDALR